MDALENGLEDLKLINAEFNSVIQEINKQETFIINQFGIKPKYVLLGVKTADVIKRGAILRQAISLDNDPLWSIQAYFDLMPIVDSSLPLKLPKEFVQVVIPLEVVGY